MAQQDKPIGLADRILNDPKLLTGAVVGAAFLGVTVWSVSVLGTKSEDKVLKSAKLSMPGSNKSEAKSSARPGDERSHLGVKRLKASEFSDSVVTADSMEALDTRDSSADEETGTLDEVAAMQLAEQNLAGLHGQVADSAAMIEAARKRREEMGSLGKIDTLGNTDFVAAGAAAMAAAEQESEGPISAARAKEIQATGLVARRSPGGGPTRHFLKRKAGTGGRSLGKGNSNLARVSAPSGTGGGGGFAGGASAGFPGGGAGPQRASGAGMGSSAVNTSPASVGGSTGDISGGSGGGGGGGRESEGKAAPPPKAFLSHGCCD
jgi:hypothetical protein